MIGPVELVGILLAFVFVMWFAWRASDVDGGR